MAKRDTNLSSLGREIERSIAGKPIKTNQMRPLKNALLHRQVAHFFAGKMRCLQLSRSNPIAAWFARCSIVFAGIRIVSQQ
jgi:hypothetical protein